MSEGLPEALGDLIEERTIKFTFEMKPRSSFEASVITEPAQATVQVEVGDEKLLQDQVRVINWVAGPGVAGGCQRRPSARRKGSPGALYRIARCWNGRSGELMCFSII